MIEITTEQQFQDEVVSSDKPVLVDFWAPWCGPCKILGPTFEALAAETPNVKFVKVNVDDSGIAAHYGVRGIPTVMAFKDGNVVRTATGAQPKAKLQEMVESVA